MASTHDLSSRAQADHSKHRCKLVHDALVKNGLYERAFPAREPEFEPTPGVTRWRIAPDPFPLSSDELAFYRTLGTHLLSFYRALNRLYQDGVRGTQPAWVAAYLDQGKPESLVSYSRMKRFRDLLPGVIRPDIVPTDHGPIITELDSVPGGIGLTGSLSRAYAELDAQTPSDGHIIGGPDGIVSGFAEMLRDQMGTRSGCVAIVVSEESKDYRPEMAWLAARLRETGLETYCVEPRAVRFTEEALWVTGETGDRPISVLYRFFELFDLKNVPKSELIMYSAKKERVGVTPPFKPALEEKLAFALLHHPILAPFWNRELGEETFGVLSSLMPRTWILDPRPMPPYGVIPGLHVAGHPVADWRNLADASQRDRQYVIKPSGFSELAWGSRGVSVGHDLPQAEWARTIESALQSFPAVPYILQQFHKGRQYDLSYYDPHSDEMVPLSGRVRLSPYYFVAGGRAELAGILATIVPLDKKLIHGMRDAIMVPCATLKA